MKSKVAVLAITSACLGYLLISSFRAIQFSNDGNPIGKLFSASTFIIVAISGLLIIREILFGIRISQMATVLDAEDKLLKDDLPKTPSGQTEKSAADERFNNISKEVEQNPDSWQAWFRVALAYDESRDRKRARAAMRRAEKLFRENR